MKFTEANGGLELCVANSSFYKKRNDSEKNVSASSDCLIGPDTPDAKTRRKAQYRRLSQTKMAKWFTESLDFLASESVMWKKHQMDRRHSVSRIFCFSRVNGQTKALRWTLVIIVGIVTALIGCFVMFNNLFLAHWKYETAYELLHNGHMVEAYFAYLGLSLTFATIAWLCCWKFPQAAESGVPEVKALLNGVNLEDFASLPVLFCTFIGTVFSCASGLPLGFEGPMIHCGAMVGALVSHGQSISIFDPKKGNQWERYQDFRRDCTHRDFVTFGAAAGIAAAFKAPIGGLLFTLEEGASFWSLSHTFQCFICGLVTLLVVNIVFLDNTKRHEDLFAFGKIDNIMPNGKPNFYLYELAIFMCIGAVGGMFCASFNHTIERVIHWKKRNTARHAWSRILEVVVITTLFTTISFLLAYAWKDCTTIPTANDDYSENEEHLLHELVQFQCPDGTYNELASLLFTPSEVALRQLYHFREVDGLGGSSFTTWPLIIFFVLYFSFAATIPGISIPFGLFIPTLLSGSIFGRLVGHWLNIGFPGYVGPAGMYAFIGGAAFLGGASRFMIAGSVILLEASGNLSYLLPLMITFASARYVGNLINVPLYDMLIEIKQLPFLHESIKHIGCIPDLPLSYVMCMDVVSLYEVETVDHIRWVLTTTSHNAFPVISRVDRRLKGIILRKVLCSLLHYNVTCRRVPVGDLMLPSPMSCRNVLLTSNNNIKQQQQQTRMPQTNGQPTVTTSHDQNAAAVDSAAHEVSHSATGTSVQRVLFRNDSNNCDGEDSVCTDCSTPPIPVAASTTTQTQTLAQIQAQAQPALIQSSFSRDEDFLQQHQQSSSYVLQRTRPDLTYAEFARGHPHYPTTTTIAAATTRAEGTQAMAQKHQLWRAEGGGEVNEGSCVDEEHDGGGSVIGDEVDDSEQDMQQESSSEPLYVDLRTQMDTSPQIAMMDGTVRKTYQTFRTLGLRHLIVVNSDFTVAGIVTRADLHEKRLHALWEAAGDDMELSLMRDLREHCNNHSLDSVERGGEEEGMREV